MILRRNNCLFLLLSSRLMLCPRAFTIGTYKSGSSLRPSTRFTTITQPTRLYFSSSTSLPEVASMRAGEIKKELESYGISTKSFLEKSELVAALTDAREQGLEPKQTAAAADTATTTASTDDSSSSSSSSSTTSTTGSSSPSSSSSSSSSTTSSTSANDGKSREEKIAAEMQACAKLKATELKKELQQLGVPTNSFFEKSEFVKALAEARVDGVQKKQSSNRESYAEYDNVEVVTDDSGPRAKGSAATVDSSSSSNDPFSGAAGNPFGGGGANPFGGGAGGNPFANMGGMGGIADMLKNMGGGGGAAAASPFGGGGGGGGGNPFGNMGGMGDMMGKAQEMMKNPKVREIVAKAQNNPKMMAKVQECMSNPSAFMKYQNDPDVKELMDEMKKFM